MAVKWDNYHGQGKTTWRARSLKVEEDLNNESLGSAYCVLCIFKVASHVLSWMR
jgi:hypothetical protein